jgi:hypothetical protein
MYSGEYDACDMLLWVYIHTGQAWKICLSTVGIEPTTFGILASIHYISSVAKSSHGNWFEKCTYV